MEKRKAKGVRGSGTGTRESKPKAERPKVEKPKDPSSVPVYDSKGKEVEKFHLDKELFDGEVNKALLYQALRMYNANQRQGTASTKTRGEVSGGGKKPWRQKGTGRARAGSTRSPLWRHGGIVFGPHPRDFRYSLPKKITRLALLSGINSKLSDGAVMGLAGLALDEPKTKKFKAVMDALKLEGKSLFVFDAVDEKVKRASRNISDVSVKNYRDFNLMDVLLCDTMVVSKAALEKLPERFKA
jgi:large subunit ribosomal protein L4